MRMRMFRASLGPSCVETSLNKAESHLLKYFSVDLNNGGKTHHLGRLRRPTTCWHLPNKTLQCFPNRHGAIDLNTLRFCT